MTLVFGLSFRSGQKPIITRYAESMDGVLNYAENQLYPESHLALGGAFRGFIRVECIDVIFA